MKILVTGAHFTPAQAVIEELKKYKDTNVVYVGRNTTREGDSSPSAESEILPKAGVKFIPITTGRLQKDFTIYTIPSLLKIPIGFLQAFYIILREKPDVILSFGGYVAVPLVIVGWLFSIPILVHEQTLVSGLANKISAIFADKIGLSFRSAKKNNKTILTGNPLRKIILEPKKQLPAQYKGIQNIAKTQKTPIILITGGNQGSHTINVTVAEILPKLTKIACVVHICGENKFKDFERLDAMGDFGGRYLVKKWIGPEYGSLLVTADLVISRAGANTLSELAFLQIPAIVIPIPYLYKDEQNQNAKFFESLGLLKTLPQSKLSGPTLLTKIQESLKNIEQFKKNAKGAKRVIMPDAAKRLALETILLR